MCAAVAIGLGQIESPRGNGREAAAVEAAVTDADALTADAGSVAAARAFYCGALRGCQVWPTERAGGSGDLWFLVGRTLVEVDSRGRGAMTPIVVDVDDPFALAERCWDAGFSVRVHEGAAGRDSLSVVDPFGRPVHLAPWVTLPRPELNAGEERR